MLQQAFHKPSPRAVEYRTLRVATDTKVRRSYDRAVAKPAQTGRARHRPGRKLPKSESAIARPLSVVSPQRRVELPGVTDTHSRMPLATKGSSYKFLVGQHTKT